MTEAASQLATSPPGDLEGALAPLPFARIGSDGDRLVASGPVCRGTLRTHDQGRVEGGRVVVTGRADAAIVSGGEKIDPRAIEAALLRHPDVVEAAVVGVSSARWGARPVAFVVAPAVGEATLRAHCRATLPPREVPDRFLRVEALPRTALGKIARGRLVDQAEAQQALGEPDRRRDGREAVEPHEGVHVARRRADGAVATPDGEGEGEGATAEPLHRDLDGEPLAEPHRALEVGLRVHERHPDALGDHAVEAADRRGDQLLEGRVAVLEDPAEEDDPRAIHLEEARRVVMNEGHDDDRR